MIGEPKSVGSVTGLVTPKATIIGKVKSRTILSKVDAGKIEIIHTNLPDYDGSYYIEPSTRVQTLLTTNKTMRHNLVVDQIRYTERPNAFGGLTVYIGEVER